MEIIITYYFLIFNFYFLIFNLLTLHVLLRIKETQRTRRITANTADTDVCIFDQIFKQKCPPCPLCFFYARSGSRRLHDVHGGS